MTPLSSDRNDRPQPQAQQTSSVPFFLAMFAAKTKAGNGDSAESKVDTHILVEVVSAVDLAPLKSSKANKDGEGDPYCVIRWAGSYVNNFAPLHRTLPVQKTLRPIWSVQTRSLYLLSVNGEAFGKSEGLRFEVWSGDFCHGCVDVGADAVLGGRSERVEYKLRDGTTSIRKRKSQRAAAGGGGQESEVERKGEEPENRGRLALRFRPATDDDMAFMHDATADSKSWRPLFLARAISSSSADCGDGMDPADFTFRQERPTSGHRRTRMEGGEKKFVVQPGPDPSRPDDTTWMTRPELDATSLEPSHKWIRAGTGTFGTLYLEVLSCDRLPDLDPGSWNRTDAFVAILFEDTLVRTDVIHDCLSPRWMPWSNRAFAFPIKHPTSVLTIGVFDYDAMLNDHDPVGRIVIDPANFDADNAYLLKYNLHSDPDHNDERGFITVRLRIHLQDERRALLESFSAAPRYHINVNSTKAYRIVKYLCKGEVNMEKSTRRTVYLYASELLSYFEYYLYLADFLIVVLLWRGRVNLSVPLPRWITFSDADEMGPLKEGASPRDNSESNRLTVSVWFPIHSIAAFEAGVIAVEEPSLIPAIFFFGVAWVMTTIMVRRSTYPSPWNRCKTIGEISSVILLGQNIHPPTAIRPNEGKEEAEIYDTIDRAKTERVMKFLMALKTAAMKYYYEYYKTDAESLVIETEDKEWTLFGDKLYYLHLLLSYMCIYLRGLRNILTWKASSYSYVFTMICFLMGVVCLLLPMDFILLWTARIWVWLFLGPWMKLVDIYFVQEHFRTRRELQENPEIKEPEVESLFRGEEFERLATLVRVAAEDALKLKHMREFKYGNYSCQVPSFDQSRFPSIPLPESTADPYKEPVGSEAPCREWTFVPGQRLQGEMIPVVEDLCGSGTDGESDGCG